MYSLDEHRTSSRINNVSTVSSSFNGAIHSASLNLGSVPINKGKKSFQLLNS